MDSCSAMGKLPSLTAIRVFDAAARHENFTRAADELGLTQSAVSHQVRMLEEQLGMRLFTRSNGRVALTDAGRRLGPQVAAAFETLGDAFANLATEDAKLLSISAASSFGTAWLAPRLGSFQLRHQDLGTRLSADWKLVDFGAGEFDLAIRIGEGGWSGLSQHFLFRVHYAPVCSPEFAARCELRDPEQLLELPRFSASADWWHDWLSDVGVRPTGVGAHSGLNLVHQTLEATAALAGTGIAMLTPFLWRSELASGRLVQPFAHVHYSAKSYWLVYPQSKRTVPKVRAFRDWLAEQIRRDAGCEAPEAFIEPIPRC